MLLKESGVQLKLTVVDTPGFGDEVDNTDWYVYIHVVMYMSTTAVLQQTS